jgi:uncharacterized damage-inducible protein DinB
MEDLRYPVGRFVAPSEFDGASRQAALSDIAATPGWLRVAVRGLSDEQLNTPYRSEGWTARQVVHHVADSHMNAYIRFRLALTEDRPTIKPYDETAWAKLPDAMDGPLEVSLDLLDALHSRLVSLMRSWGEAEWKREFMHPERGPMTLERNAALYAWHGRHHTAHVTSLRKRMGW